MSAPSTEPEVEKYAACLTCGIDLATSQDGDEHTAATLEEDRNKHPDGLGSSHRLRLTSPSAGHSRSEVDYAIERAIEALFESLDSQVYRGRFTEQEVTESLRDYPDLADGWDVWRDEDEAGVR